MRISVLSGLGAGLLLAVVTACGGSTATPAPAASAAGPGAAKPTCAAGIGTGQQVAMANIAYTPNTSAVSAGGTVSWTNGDTVTHTVTFDNGPDCGNVTVGSSITATFAAAGTYAYHCTIHSSMHGTVTVS